MISGGPVGPVLGDGGGGLVIQGVQNKVIVLVMHSLYFGHPETTKQQDWCATSKSSDYPGPVSD